MAVKLKLVLTTSEPGNRPDETKTTVTTWGNVTEKLTAAEVASLIRNAVSEIDPQAVFELGAAGHDPDDGAA